ncbi:MAG: DUF927 domain-containing protein [Azospirillum sp.]|nr:DUF927 domain-containing protein [Azospirillum sp.]
MTPILPVPADAPPPRFRHRFGSPTTTWPYRLADGRLVGLVARFDGVDDGRPAKEVLPYSWCELPDGRRGWRAKAFPEPRTLYLLPELARRPDAPVLVVEGEKAADAAAGRFADHAVTTSPGGAKAAGKADWSALAGRRLVIWPDHDGPGRAYAGDVARLALAAAALEVRVVAVPDDFPPAWDLADPSPEGADLDALLAAAALWLPPAAERPKTAWVPLYRTTERGVERRIERPNRDTGETDEAWILVCSPIAVAAFARDGEREGWSLLLDLVDPDRCSHLPESFRAEILPGHDATMVSKTLLRSGLLIGSGGKTQSVQRLPGFSKSVRCYLLSAAILSSRDGDDCDGAPSGGSNVTPVTPPAPSGVTGIAQSEQRCYTGYTRYTENQSNPLDGGRDEQHERAAIAEFDGGLPRPDAERIAGLDPGGGIR